MGIRAFPWVRLAHVNKGDTYEDAKLKLSLLVTTAHSWGENIIIPNYEDECSSISPRSLADWLYGFLNWKGETGWSTLAWLNNDVDFRPIARDSALLQIFPTDARWPINEIGKKMGDCVWHARDKGFTYVGVTYQTYAGAQPAWYDCASCMHSTYPGNLIGHGQWGDWYQ
jgi:hypothetical protein